MVSDPLATMREDYSRAGLDESDLLPDPVAMVRRWLDEAAAAGLHEPNAMVVSTVSAAGGAVVADGAAQGALRRRLRVLHQHRLPQGPRARR